MRNDDGRASYARSQSSKVCTQATKIIEMYEAQMRKAIRPDDKAENIELSLKMLAEAKSNIAATAQSLR